MLICQGASVAADLVGPGGSVTGVDHSPEALARARYRAAQRGLAQVQFIEGDIHDPAPGGPYDAIVERLTLWLVPDPAEVLRRQATVLRPGGLVVAGEGVQSTARSVPQSALWTQLMSWQQEAFARAGMEHIGPRLWAIVEAAGLRRLGMMETKPYTAPGDVDGLAWMVETFRSAFLPLFAGTGVATAEQIGVHTLEQRLRDEWEKTGMAFTPGSGVTVWATTGPE
jgi:SAM-dependent methyltransferase